MLKAENLSVAFGKRKILSELSFNVEKGKFTAVIGRNGSGKSTLLSALSGNLEYSGSILLDGKSIKEIPRSERARKAAFLPQAIPTVGVTAFELVSFGRSPRLGLSGKAGDGDRCAVHSAMELLGIEELAQKRADKISGGEFRLCCLAMVLAQDTDLLLLDEPSASLDIANERRVCGILSELVKNEGKTVLTAIHSLAAAVEYADNIILLEGGTIVFCGTVEECLENSIIEKNFSVTKHQEGANIWFS